MPSDGGIADWRAIRAAYEGGTDTLATIAAHHNISRQAVHKRAKLEGWVRVPRKFTRGKKPTQCYPNEPQPVTIITPIPREELEAAARMEAIRSIEVVRQHRVSLSKATLQCDGLSAMLDLCILSAEEGVTPMQLDGYVDILEKLVRTRERLIRMERVAFGLDADGSEGEHQGGIALNPEQKEALRAAVAVRFKAQVLDS